IPPVFAPETIADAIVHLSLHPRREVWIGGSAVKAILGQKVIGPLLDRYLARRGYRDQQDAVPVEPYRRDNLFYPLEGDRGAPGPSRDLGRHPSARGWLASPRRARAGGAAAAGLARGAVWARART